MRLKSKVSRQAVHSLADRRSAKIPSAIFETPTTTSYFPEREYFEFVNAACWLFSRTGILFIADEQVPIHIQSIESIPMTAKSLGRMIRDRRKSLGMKQADLALVSGTGLRFISDLENGKETCQLGRALQVLETLGLNTTIQPRDK